MERNSNKSTCATGRNKSNASNSETMSKIDKDQQDQKPKTSKLAIASALVGFGGICCWILFRMFWFLNSPSEEVFISFLFYFPYVSIPVAFFLAIVAILQIRTIKTSGMLTYKVFAATGIAEATFQLIVLFILPLFPSDLSYEEACRAQMEIIGIQLKIYASNSDNQYPTADSWCDLLMMHTKVTEDLFKCPGLEKGRCTFAVNPNCKPNSIVDTVLLFETRDGWNQHGGPELLNTKNHGGKGCNILFNDGRVEFVPKKRFDELKWNAEENESVGKGFSK